MPRVAIVSDTHVPSRAAALPGWVREELSAADHVLHAGDVDSREALEAIRDLSAELTVVAGNMDPPIDLPRVATATVGGVTFVLTHGTGPPESYRDRVAGIVREHDPGVGTADADDAASAAADIPDAPAGTGPDGCAGPVGVSGHSHEVLDTTHDGGEPSRARRGSDGEQREPSGVRLLNPGSATGAFPAERATLFRATAADGELDVELLEG